MACYMPEPCKFPPLDSCQKRFLWTHKEVDLAPHPVVGLALQVGETEKFPQKSIIMYSEHPVSVYKSRQRCIIKRKECLLIVCVKQSRRLRQAEGGQQESQRSVAVSMEKRSPLILWQLLKNNMIIIIESFATGKIDPEA